MLNYKAIKIADIKANIDKGIIEGYASHFGNKDSHGDIIQKGAFAKTINENSSRVKVLWQHDMREPIGKPLSMVEDEKGLFTTSKISETEIGKKALILARDGVLNEMSIGFNVIKEEYDKSKNVNIIKEVKLWEYSLVTFASNPMAMVTDIKHLINDYQYSKGNVLDIIAEKLYEQIKALANNDEPSKDTQRELTNDEVIEIMQAIKQIKN